MGLRNRQGMVERVMETWICTASDVRAIAFQVAGAAAAVFMERHPQDVMPTDEITENVEAILAEHGVAKP